MQHLVIKIILFHKLEQQENLHIYKYIFQKAAIAVWTRKLGTLREKRQYSEFFWHAFSHIRPEYGEILGIPKAGKHRPENFRIPTLFSQRQSLTLERIFSQNGQTHFKNLAKLAAYSESFHTAKTKRFPKLVNGLRWLTIFAKLTILRV